MEVIPGVSAVGPVTNEVSVVGPVTNEVSAVGLVTNEELCQVFWGIIIKNCMHKYSLQLGNYYQELYA